MNVSIDKSVFRCLCAECGKNHKEANLHKIEIGSDHKNRITFYLCYSCMKKLEAELKKVRPEGVSPKKICESESQHPEDAKDCLYCRECIISTID